MTLVLSPLEISLGRNPRLCCGCHVQVLQGNSLRVTVFFSRDALKSPMPMPDVFPVGREDVFTRFPALGKRRRFLWEKTLSATTI